MATTHGEGVRRPPPRGGRARVYPGLQGLLQDEDISYNGRKLLSLRLSAIKRAMVVDASVTPAFLERITGERCPVTHR